MTPENTAKLIAAAPTVFAPGFKFECGDGWFDLIHAAACGIEAINRQTPEGWRSEATQVKEKLGGLRFYVTLETPAISFLIGVAEGTSFNVCELCGGDGTTSRTGWLRTRCDECKGVR